LGGWWCIKQVSTPFPACLQRRRWLHLGLLLLLLLWRLLGPALPHALVLLLLQRLLLWWLLLLLLPACKRRR
jgi:hypothetical protein